MIFITENDVMKAGLPIYHIDRVVRETGKLFEDEEHIIYVKRALKKGIEVHPLGALHDVKKGTLYTCSNCGTRLGWGPNAARLANYCHGCGQKIDWKGTPRE